MRLIANLTATITIITVLAAATGVALTTASPVPASPSQDTGAKLYWTEYQWDAVTGTIMRANLDGSQLQSLFRFHYGQVHGINLDPANRKMYWAVSGLLNSSTPRVEFRRANMDGSQDEYLFGWRQPSAVEDLWTVPTDLALDVAAGKLYWTARGERYIQLRLEAYGLIQRANLDGSHIETLVSGLQDVPREIALDVAGGKMYWLSGGNIEQANLDGTNVESTLPQASSLSSLVLDADASTLYGSSNGEIHRINLETAHAQTLLQGIGASDLAIDLADGHLYWSNYGEGSILRADLDGSGAEALISGAAEPQNMAFGPASEPLPTPTLVPAATLNPVATTISPDTSEVGMGSASASAATADLPTPVSRPETAIGAPVINFHASQTQITVGEPVTLTLSVANSISRPEMTLQLVLQLPSGVSINGEGLGRECSVQCAIIYRVPAGENKEFPLTAIANQTGSFNIDGLTEWYFGDEPIGTHFGETVSQTLEVVEPAPASTETPTFLATSTPTLPPHVGEPTVNLHSTRTAVSLGEPVKLVLSVVNSIAKPEMTLKLILQVPSGWSITGAGFADSCSGQCTAIYEVPSGKERAINLTMLPNQPGSFVVDAQMEWWFGDDRATLDGGRKSLELTVAGSRHAASTLAPTAELPAITAPPAGEKENGCGTPMVSNGESDLAWLGLLVLPLLGLVSRPIGSRTRPDPRRSSPSGIPYTATSA